MSFHIDNVDHGLMDSHSFQLLHETTCDLAGLPYLPEGLLVLASIGLFLWLWKRCARQKLIGDMPHRKRCEAHLQRLATIGELCAGMAHEINNPLTIVTIGLGIIRETLQEDGTMNETYDKRLSDIETAARRIQDVVITLKGLTRKVSANEMRLISFRELADGAIILVHRRCVQSGIDLKTDTISSDQIVECAPPEITQILAILMLNAIEALRTSDQEEKWIKLAVSQNKSHVCLSVSNNGPLIPDNLRESIFERYFTTKSEDDGTGLGLSIARELAERHKGQLFLSDKADLTTFVLCLPARHS